MREAHEHWQDRVEYLKEMQLYHQSQVVLCVAREPKGSSYQTVPLQYQPPKTKKFTRRFLWRPDQRHTIILRSQGGWENLALWYYQPVCQCEQGRYLFHRSSKNYLIRLQRHFYNTLALFTVKSSVQNNTSFLYCPDIPTENWYLLFPALCCEEPADSVYALWQRKDVWRVSGYP